MVLPLPAGAGQKLTMAQVAGFAKRAGFPDNQLANAVAVAWAESKGDTAAIGRNSTSSDYGLWQINDKYHADLLNNAQWWSPGINAQMAKSVYDGSKGWTPWSTWISGAYRQYLPEASLAAVNPDMTGVTKEGAATITTNPLSELFAPFAAIAEAFKAVATGVFKTSAWVANPKNWVRVAYIGIGGTLIVGALVIVVGGKMAQPVISAVAGSPVSPAGAAKKVVKSAAVKTAASAKGAS